MWMIWQRWGSFGRGSDGVGVVLMMQYGREVYILVVVQIMQYFVLK